jgi:hypothetical protein
VDPVPDILLRRKCGSAGNRTRDLWVCSQGLWPLDHRGCRYIYITMTILDGIHLLATSSKHNVSETGFYPRLQVEPTPVGPETETSFSPAATWVGSSCRRRQNPHSDTPGFKWKTTWRMPPSDLQGRNIPEDGILHSHRRESHKFYKRHDDGQYPKL